MRLILIGGLMAATALLGGGVERAAAEGVLNLYSARHYDTDERLYADFTAATGVVINRIEADADALIERMTAEGANSPADVLLTVDAGRIWRAEQAGLLQGFQSAALESAIPAELRHPDGKWFAFSRRARMIFFNKERVSEPPATYEALADPKYRGMICIRSSSNMYNLSLMAALIARAGAPAAEAWAAGVYANLARKPEGGDTDQLRGLVSGACSIAVANSYYFARGLRGDVDGLTSGIAKIGWVFPNQDDRGAHVNVSVAAIAANAPNVENARKFLEYLATPSAQAYFADGNNEYPVVAGVDVGPALKQLGDFKADTLPLTALGENQGAAQVIYATVGWP